MKKYTLILQGGGAKGAYEAGAIKALMEYGIRFDCVCGASIGAINGAVVAQGDGEKLVDLWQAIDTDMVFAYDEMFTECRGKSVKELIKKSPTIIKHVLKSGINVEAGEEFLADNICEDTIRASDINYGLITVSAQRKEVKVLELFKQDIPQGKLFDYVCASAAFPLFRKVVIDGEYFIDGGVYDNLPINMAVNKGYRDIIAIELKGIAPKRKVKSEGVNVISIVPSVKPGWVLGFTKENIQRALQIGYEDAKAIIAEGVFDEKIGGNYEQ